MKWYTLDERLPPKHDHKVTKSVLVWSFDGPGCAVITAQGVMKDGVNYPFEIDHWIETFSGQRLITPVTHWMPMPAHPLTDKDSHRKLDLSSPEKIRKETGQYTMPHKPLLKHEGAPAEPCPRCGRYLWECIGCGS